MRALATSVKTRRLGLCVVPWELVRVCRKAVAGSRKAKTVTLRSCDDTSFIVSLVIKERRTEGNYTIAKLFFSQ